MQETHSAPLAGAKPPTSEEGEPTHLGLEGSNVIISDDSYDPQDMGGGNSTALPPKPRADRISSLSSRPNRGSLLGVAEGSGKGGSIDGQNLGAGEKGMFKVSKANVRSYGDMLLSISS
ncbi:hypothetical protein DUNSADRAFT_10017 [Dunaliella salina]|uniref:Encoded protein n=1 Tax=Dunaliella salina TaxID=3046 RepID=A0ABQ7GG74_DUNSA|nr:hypothetical protein DUNSADRAFT_10017 [Dunaliella salina]|eukprot:KAF5833601.1 hypothetical protein DUNSADRAFT_10017 [Dunaliella salina]